MGARVKLLSGMTLHVAREQGETAVTMHSRQLQNQRRVQVRRLLESVMLCPVSGIFVQMIKPERILPGVHFLQQATSEHRPLGFSDLAFKNGLLHPDTIILAGPGHAAQSFLPRLVRGRDIVRDQDKHTRYFGMNGI